MLLLLHDVRYADDDGEDGRGDRYLGPLLYMAATAFWVKLHMMSATVWNVTDPCLLSLYCEINATSLSSSASEAPYVNIIY